MLSVRAPPSIIPRGGRELGDKKAATVVMPDDKKASAATLAHIDELLDEALKQTFPASDPVAINIERASDRWRDTKSNGS
jgi:hypothetical protein